MNKLSKIERQRNINLPEIYKDFYECCAESVPPKFVGSSLINDDPDLYESAIELLRENNVENFLTHDDFVFMMHQGYIFWYFKADGNPDPVVFGYFEGRLQQDDLGNFSKFIKGE